jgi:hypothetical protein
VNYAFAYACCYDTSMGPYTWYLVPCNELSLLCLSVRNSGATLHPSLSNNRSEEGCLWLGSKEYARQDDGEAGNNTACYSA